MDGSEVKISFGFKKKPDNKLINLPSSTKEKKEEIEYIKTIENKKIKGNKNVTSFSERSIPITNNRNAKEPTFEDYIETPVEEFGLAMLRGMGWKECEGGVKPVEPYIRPKGAGLGHKFC